jgi:uncharacterized protein (TIGR01244 family)
VRSAVATALVAVALAAPHGCGREPARDRSPGVAPPTTDPGAAPAGDRAAALAGVGLPNGRVLDGRVLVGGQPTEAQLARAIELGVRTIVNLRTPAEAEGYAADRAIPGGVRYVELPVDVATGLGLDATTAADLAAAIAGDAPALVHCGSGDRVGALWALKRGLVDGVPLEQALRDGEAAGLQREATRAAVERRLRER